MRSRIRVILTVVHLIMSRSKTGRDPLYGGRLKEL